MGFEFSINYKLGKGRYSKVLQGIYKSSQKKVIVLFKNKKKILRIKSLK